MLGIAMCTHYLSDLGLSWGYGIVEHQLITFKKNHATNNENAKIIVKPCHMGYNNSVTYCCMRIDD